MSDKRSVHTDALETLGGLISKNEKRDAIHLAVEPMEAGEMLRPGSHVRIGADGKAYFKEEKAMGKPLIGIVDPFLENSVLTGQGFWLIIYPRKINSLRHVWTHPDLPDTPDLVVHDKETSEAWMRSFLKEHGAEEDYHDVLAAARRSDDDDYLYCGFSIYGEIPAEFWTHVEILTGAIIPMDCRAKSFSCSC